MFNRFKKTCLLFTTLCIFALSACDVNAKAIAVIDVNQIITTGVHAKQAATEIKKAQEIFQYNLSVIEKKLARYKNKQQAEMYLNSASQQLQAQLNASQNAVKNALVVTLNSAIEEEKEKHRLILSKASIIHSTDKYDITDDIQEIYNAKKVVFPPLPKKIDKPNLPADTGK